MKFLRSKRVFIGSLVLYGAFLLHYVHSTLAITLPKENVVSVYTTESGYDLKMLLCMRMKAATKSLSLSSFGLSDRHILGILAQKKDEDIELIVKTDPGKGAKNKGVSGILHRKIVVVDEDEVYLGSTNLTYRGLKWHNNMVVGFKNRSLAEALLSESSYKDETTKLFLLPKEAKSALSTLLQKIRNAKERIYVAMYVFTHQEIAKEIALAKERGVTVVIYLDQGASKYMNKKVIQFLKDHDILPFTIKTKGLLHHKCALIDDCFVFGSANWSQSAFTRNEELIIFLENEAKTILPFFQKMAKRKLPLT